MGCKGSRGGGRFVVKVFVFSRVVVLIFVFLELVLGWMCLGGGWAVVGGAG